MRVLREPSANTLSAPTVTSPRVPGTIDPPAMPRAPEALGLTPREGEVVLAMGRGLSNAEIARELSIGKGTVQFHLHQAFEKLGVASRLEAFRVLIDQAIFGNDFDWL